MRTNKPTNRLLKGILSVSVNQYLKHLALCKSRWNAFNLTKFFAIFFFACGVVFTPLAAKAIPSIPTAPKQQNTVDCFDYYKFGSVSVNIIDGMRQTVPGVPLKFKAKISNQNDYPIVDGAVYVKIFKKQNSPEASHANSAFLVDQFFAQEDVSLDAKTEKDLEFTWQVPAYVGSGDYQLATFFTSAKKFNLLGLSFTDDIVGNTFDFSVKSEQKPVEFDKNNVQINGKQYLFAAFPPRLPKDAPAHITVNLINPTEQAQEVPVNWTLYAWDAQNEENKLDIKRELISLQAKETKTLEYETEGNIYPVYFLVVSAEYQDTKSILDIRFAREGIDRVRINFPAVTKYPLKKGEQNTLFACAHNSGQSGLVENNRLVLSLLDENKKPLHTYTYTGSVTGAMMGVKDDFTPAENLENFTLQAELFTGEKLVDSAEMLYDCAKINPKFCPQKPSKEIAKPLVEPAISEKPATSPRSVLKPLLAILLFSAFVSLIFLFLKKRKSSLKNLFLFVLASSFMLLGAFSEKAMATNEQWTCSNRDLNGKPVGAGDVYCSTTVPKQFAYRYHPGTYYLGLASPSFTVHYHTQITTKQTDRPWIVFPLRSLDNNSIVAVGSEINFEIGNLEDTDLYWFGTGYSVDSPYGHWVNNFLRPSNTRCSSDNLVDSGSCQAFVDFSVQKPAISIDHTGSTAGLSCDAAGTKCTVTSKGEIKSKISFNNTFGKMYYYVYGPSGDFNHDCGTMGNGGCAYVGPMVTCDNATSAGSASMCTDTTALDGSKVDHIIELPKEEVNYRFFAVDPNDPPNAPTISGQTTACSGVASSYTFTSTDNNNDQIQYGIDWNKDGTIDEWLPGQTSYVPSWTAQTTSHIWSTLGSTAFQALAIDANGSSSSWTPYTITVNNCGSVDGSCGTAAKSYPSSASAWEANTSFCLKGAFDPPPSPPPFPAEGATTTWSCKGSNGGKNVTCEAKHNSAGKCGAENGKVYAATQTIWSTTDFCAMGTTSPSSPVFPTCTNAASASAVWTCIGNESSLDCSASKQCALTTAECGTAAKNYLSTETSWGANTFCAPNKGAPNPSNPVFPWINGKTTWKCVVTSTDSRDCTATRSSNLPPYKPQISNPTTSSLRQFLQFFAGVFNFDDYFNGIYAVETIHELSLQNEDKWIKPNEENFLDWFIAFLSPEKAEAASGDEAGEPARARVPRNVNVSQTGATVAPEQTGTGAEVNILATISIYNSKIISQEKNKLKISFDLKNDSQVQPQIKYAIQLLKVLPDGGQIKTDEKVYDEIIDLGAGELVHKEIEYNAPEYLTGKYQVWILSANLNSLPFGVSQAGEIELTGNNNYLEILADSCYLTVQGEAAEQKYNLRQGVDVVPAENLVANCQIKNHFNTEITIIPQFETYWRTTMGKLVSSKQLEEFNVPQGEEQQLNLIIPKAEQPQAYDAVLSFQDKNGQTISSKVVFHYVLRGLSATIQNIRLDKDFYLQGETANVIFDWMPSADSFFGSRAGSGTKIENASAEFFMTDQNNAKCGESVKKSIEIGKYKENLIIPVIIDCFNPQIAVTIKDAQGNILDKNSFQATSKSQESLTKKSESAPPKNTVVGKNQNQSENQNKNILIVLFVALLVALGSYAIVRKRKINDFKMLLIVVGGMLAGMCFNVSNAKAISWSVSYPEYEAVAYFTASLDKGTYGLGEKVSVYGTGSDGYCYNGEQSIELDVISPVSVKLFSEPALSGSTNFVAPTANGSYTVSLRGWTWEAYGNASLSYTVAGDPPKCTASFSPSVINKGDSTTLNWTSGSDADGKIPYSCDGNIGAGTLASANGTLKFNNVQSDTQICTLDVVDKFSNKSQCSAMLEAVDAPSCNIWFSEGLLGIKTITKVIPDDRLFMRWSSQFDQDLLLPKTCIGDISGTKSGNWSTSGLSFFPKAYENYSCTAEAKSKTGKVANCAGSIVLDCSDTNLYCSASDIGKLRCVNGVIQTCKDWHTENPKTNSCNKWKDTGNCAVNGACGTANKTYSATATSWGADTFCSAGTANPASPAFPAAGATTTWKCQGSNGGTTADCSASRSNSTDGVCGAENGKNYATSATKWDTNNFCNPISNNPSPTPAFPAVGASITWVCQGSSGGAAANCSASH